MTSSCPTPFTVTEKIKMKDGKYVILCIDDDPDFLESLRLVLESSGYVVETADSAEQGFAVYNEVSPDLILVDMVMEDSDSGARLIRKLMKKGPLPPVFMLSSIGDTLTGNLDYADLEINGILQKPISTLMLLETLQRKLGG